MTTEEQLARLMDPNAGTSGARFQFLASFAAECQQRATDTEARDQFEFIAAVARVGVQAETQPPE